MPVPIHRIKRKPGFGEAKSAYEAIYIVFNYVQWFLVAGTVYYFVNKYDKNLADTIIVIFLSALMYPISNVLSIILLGAINIQSFLAFNLLGIIISIVIALFGYQHLIRVIVFIATHQGGS